MLYFVWLKPLLFIKSRLLAPLLLIRKNKNRYAEFITILWKLAAQNFPRFYNSFMQTKPNKPSMEIRSISSRLISHKPVPVRKIQTFFPTTNQPTIGLGLFDSGHGPVYMLRRAWWSEVILICNESHPWEESSPRHLFWILCKVWSPFLSISICLSHPKESITILFLIQKITSICGSSLYTLCFRAWCNIFLCWFSRAWV